ncbi:MAG: Glu-tRNA(Gln) amidotransferase subunit GatE [Candidatus Zixiibacteriota bacterium]|nr:MAG: Glu-tRNA(Gln) amidotransferase subunit GatE [candidate division Zixibacteria bacterium]
MKSSRTDKYYYDIGFKCGLEIHQQLLTEKKLFCRCPAGYRNDRPDGQIIRHMRPTLSELGEYDGTALMEFKTKKNVTYQLYRENCCTYEMDDTPPFPINREALDIALKLAMLLNCAIVDEVHVSRKQYLDGSIPTGFQRTAIVGVSGWVPYKGRKINITHVCLEEDACREISDRGHEIVFRTDRLSMPLLEVITAPDMLTPTEAMEVDALLGRILKSSGLVRRGIGSVRQDVNVSINGGDRGEIKGIPRTGMIEKLTAIEAERQLGLLGIKETLRLRGISDKTIHGEKYDLTETLKKSKNPVIKKVREYRRKIKAIKLHGFAGIMSHQTQPGKYFADEISGRVKVIACLDSDPNIAVSDFSESAGFTPQDWNAIKKECAFKHTDAVVVVWGPEEDVNTALSEIKIRAVEATRGVPQETRQALAGDVTGFERVLPGPDRMYPDTDSAPVKVTGDMLERLKSEISPPVYQVEDEWQKLGITGEIARKAVVSPYKDIFEKLIKEFRFPHQFAWAALNRLGFNKFTDNGHYSGRVIELFEFYKNGEVSKDSLLGLLDSFYRDIEKDLADVLKDHKLVDIASAEVQSLIEEYSRETADMRFANGDDRVNYICGRIKAHFGGRIDGAALRGRVAGRGRV